MEGKSLLDIQREHNKYNAEVLEEILEIFKRRAVPVRRMEQILLRAQDEIVQRACL